MLEHWIAVNMVEGVGPARLKKLLEEHGSIEEVCRVLDAPLNKAEEEIEKADKKNIKILSKEDKEYPELLKQIHDPPPVIYVKGELLEKDKNAIAIVGTRNPSKYGIETTRQLAKELASLGITIVSGLALGIDAAAHRGALEAGGRTIAVLGCGADRIYPIENAELYHNVSAIVSEYPIGFQQEKWTFPQRNRIISGLSLGVIIIEGGYKSGAMITAKEALDQGREVFAVPQNIDSELGRGPHWLIKQGAKLVESIEDVLDELQNVLSIKRNAIPGPAIKKDYSSLLPEEQRIITCLSNEPKHVDSIATETGLPIARISSLLMMMEVKKMVKQLPGKLFILQ